MVAVRADPCVRLNAFLYLFTLEILSEDGLRGSSGLLQEIAKLCHARQSSAPVKHVVSVAVLVIHVASGLHKQLDDLEPSRHVTLHAIIADQSQPRTHDKTN